jgi:hypothetical protein
MVAQRAGENDNAQMARAHQAITANRFTGFLRPLCEEQS